MFCVSHHKVHVQFSYSPTPCMKGTRRVHGTQNAPECESLLHVLDLLGEVDRELREP